MSSLSEVCKLIVDCPHSTARNEGEGYPLIRTPNIGKGRFNLENVHRVSEEIYNIRNTRAVPQDDDLILAREAPAGNVAIIKNGDKFCLGQRTVLIRPDKGKVNPDFLVYYLLSPEQQNKLLSQANGSTVDHVNLPIIRNLQLSLPPLPVQQRIASILSAYDDIIENNQKQIKLLEEAAQRLYKEWFVDLRFPGHEGVKVVDGVPEGWSRTRLDEVIEFNPKVSLTKERIKEFVPMSALSNTAMILDTNEITYTQSNSGSKFKNDDTIMARITPCLENGKIAFVQELKSEEGAVGSTEYIVLRSRLLCPSMVYLLSRMQDFRKYAINNMSGSDGRQRVKVERLMEYEYLKPTNDLVCEFSSKVTPMFKNIKHLSKLNAILREARDRLLPKLMSGEIEV